ncbi:MAG: flagellar motor switch protein FliN [Gammaproteobacteria bacterium]|nr:flagellar motor switch protein FliN [Gammaproteobacteria bacterium]
MSDNDNVAEDDWAAAMAEQAAATGGGGDADDIIDGVAPAAMQNLTADGGTGEPGSLENILDIPVTLAVEIGSTKVSIRNLLQFNQGSVVELDRLAGEPLDVLVNGTLIAHGEVVVVNEKFGIRLTDVVSAHERVRKLA